MKVASTVRGGAVRKGLTGDTTLSETGMVYGSISTSLAAYSTKLVTTALQWSYAQAEVDVSSQHLEAAAEQLTVRRDNIQVIDAQHPKREDESEKQKSPEELEERKPNGEKEEKRGRKKRSPKEPELPNPK